MMKILKFLAVLMLVPSLCFGSASRDYDDVNDFSSWSTNLDVTTGDVTWGGWGRTTEDAGTDFLMGKKDGTGFNAGYGIAQSTTDVWSCVVADGADLLGSTGTTDTDGAWAFVVCTWNASSEVTRLFVNGSQDDTDTGSGVIDSLTNAVALRAGCDGATNNDYRGLISLGFVNRSVLTDVEINQLLWFPCSIPLETCGMLMSPDADVGSSKISITVSGTGGTSQSGPPVMFGGGLPL